MKHLLSICTGLVGVALYYILLSIFFGDAFLDIEIAPKLQSCREYLYESICVSYSYFLTYLLQIHILLMCFIIIAICLAVTSVLNLKNRLCIFAVGLTYFFTQILLNFIFVTQEIIVTLLFAFIFQSVLFMFVLWVGRYLTSHLRRDC